MTIAGPNTNTPKNNQTLIFPYKRFNSVEFQFPVKSIVITTNGIATLLKANIRALDWGDKVMSATGLIEGINCVMHVTKLMLAVN